MMSTVTLCSLRPIAAAAIFLGLVACQSEAPSALNSPLMPVSFQIGDATGSMPELGKIKVCKSSSSNVSGSFSFSRRAQGASTGSALTNATIDPSNCTVVAEDDGPNGVGSFVTITETSAGLVSVTGQRITAPGGIANESFTNGGTLFVNSFHGFTITYNNFVEPPPPPSGNNGCSPGYWKNHKFPAGYTSTTTFASVFGNNVYGSATLLTVLKTGGGGLAALGRQIREHKPGFGVPIAPGTLWMTPPRGTPAGFFLRRRGGESKAPIDLKQMPQTVSITASNPRSAL